MLSFTLSCLFLHYYLNLHTINAINFTFHLDFLCYTLDQLRRISHTIITKLKLNFCLMLCADCFLRFFLLISLYFVRPKNGKSSVDFSVSQIKSIVHCTAVLMMIKFQVFSHSLYDSAFCKKKVSLPAKKHKKSNHFSVFLATKLLRTTSFHVWILLYYFFSFVCILCYFGEPSIKVCCFSRLCCFL